MSVDGYYVRSWAYRILRPLAICQLIERQLATADFAVDKTAPALVQSHDAAGESLSGDRILLDHQAQWNDQSDHFFSDARRAAAASLIVNEPPQPPRVMDYTEFVDSLSTQRRRSSAVTALFSIFAACNSTLLENPIFWLRLVAYGRVCSLLLETQGKALGFRYRPYDTSALLRGIPEVRIKSPFTVPEYVRAIDEVARECL
jgi:hypothetical protein